MGIKIKSLYQAGVEERKYEEDIKNGLIIPATTGRRYLDSRLLGGTNDTDIILLAGTCLSGDTKIRIKRHNKKKSTREYKLSELYKKLNNISRSRWDLNVKTSVVCYAQDLQRMSTVEIDKVISTGAKSVYKVTLENGNTIKATKEHRFLTNILGLESNYIRLKNLKINDKIVCKGINPKEKKGRKKRSYRKEVITKMPFYYTAADKIVKNNGKKYLYQRVKLHRLMYDAGLNNLTKKQFLKEVKTNPNHNLKLSDPKLEIHHKNEIKTDNSFSNLELLTTSQHCKEHSNSFLQRGSHAIHYSKIVSIEYSGIEETYDIMCKDPYHNFMANGIVTHNSGVGKSTEINQICYNIATLNKNCRILFMSFEMPGRKLAAKLISKNIKRSLRDMYQKDTSLFAKEQLNSLQGIPFDIVELPLNIDQVDSVITSYQTKYPNDRIHIVFDHTLLVENLRGDKDHDTVVQLSSFMNKTKKIGSRVYIVVSQLNDEILRSNRLSLPHRQYPDKGDLFGSQSTYHVCNNAVFLMNPYLMNLPSNTYGPNKLPLEIKFKGEASSRKTIMAHTLKARDGTPGVDVLLNNLEFSELIELPKSKMDLINNKYNLI